MNEEDKKCKNCKWFDKLERMDQCVCLQYEDEGRIDWTEENSDCEDWEEE